MMKMMMITGAYPGGRAPSPAPQKVLFLNGNINFTFKKRRRPPPVKKNGNHNLQIFFAFL